MGNSGKQAHDFYADVIKHNKIWTIRDDQEFVIFTLPYGTKTQPFWSKITRIEKIIKNEPSFSKFEIVEVSWDEFQNEWAPKMEQSNISIGVNWGGKNLSGFDMSANQLIKIVDLNKAALTHHSSGTPNGAP